jgi:hypothetical protein
LDTAGEDAREIRHAQGRTDIHAGFWLVNLKKRDHFRGIDVNWRIILKWIIKQYDRGVDKTDLPLYRDKFRRVVSTAMNLRFP